MALHVRVAFELLSPDAIGWTCYAETAGGVVVATYRKLLREGRIDPAAETVLLNTGDGLKTLDAVEATSKPTMVISPSYDEFEAEYSKVVS